MFLKNAWYVAAWDHEVTAEKPFGRVLLNEPVVMYRDTKGQVVALEDRCRHRHYPLNRGVVVGDRIECELRIHARVHRERARDEQQRVAVCRRSGDELGADIARRARPVVDDDLLAPCFGELLAEQACEQIGAAARRVRHDPAHRLHREVLRESMRKSRCEQYADYEAANRNDHVGSNAQRRRMQYE